jgi:hypothetical protein
VRIFSATIPACTTDSALSTASSLIITTNSSPPKRATVAAAVQLFLMLQYRNGYRCIETGSFFDDEIARDWMYIDVTPFCFSDPVFWIEQGRIRTHLLN